MLSFFFVVRSIFQRVSPPFGMPPQTLQVVPEEKHLNKSFGRGSWPGPGNLVSTDNHICEFSKSEQNLKTKEFVIDSHNEIESGNINKDIITGSKSENMLIKININCNPQRVRANTICNISSNNTLKVKQSDSLMSINQLDVPEILTSTSSLGMDKDSNLQPLLPHTKRKKSKLVSSKSMTNVKQTLKLNKFKSGHSNSVHPDTETILSKSLNNINTEPDVNGEVNDELEHKKVFRTSRGLRHPFGRNETGILQVFAAYETGLASGMYPFFTFII